MATIWAKDAHSPGRLAAAGMVLLFVAGTGSARLNALSLEESVARSGRASNPMIAQLIETSDLTEAIQICAELGQRSDAAVGSIILRLYSRAEENNDVRSGLLLRLLLQDVFFPGAGQRPDQARVLANKAALTHLAESLQSVRDPQTKRLIILMLPDLRAEAARKALAAEGGFLIGKLETDGGHFAVERMSEALAFLSCSVALGGSVYRDETIRLVELSRDRAFVVQARAALAVLR